jgi:hypothetical protein
VVRREAWILIAILAALVGLSRVLAARQEAAPPTTPTGASRSLFGPDLGNVVDLEVAPTDGATFRMSRGTDGLWVVQLPFSAAANQGLAESAATQITALRVLSAVSGDLADFGLDPPTNLVTAVFADGTRHVLEVGAQTPTQSGYYVRLDHADMFIVDTFGLDALLTVLTSPPYLETPTPSPRPPETPHPTGTITPTS